MTAFQLFLRWAGAFAPLPSLQVLFDPLPYAFISGLIQIIPVYSLHAFFTLHACCLFVSRTYCDTILRLLVLMYECGLALGF